MKLHTASVLLLILTLESGCSAQNRFFISAPNVFHVGVKERVLVQMGEPYSTSVTLYLQHETENTVVSNKETVNCAGEQDIKTVELTINREIMSRMRPQKHHPPYLMLVAESPSFRGRKLTRVLVSKHRGYIFIQTDQPIYNPTQKVNYRIFTLDHTFRPHEEVFQITVYNAVGNKIMRSLKTGKGGILKGIFPIPDVSKPGTWKITAHYEDDETNAASREFRVQKFVLPSFEVSIGLEQNYILLNDENFEFTISARYSHGEKVRGAYHCQFGMVKKERTQGQRVKPEFIRGLELTGTVQEGSAKVSHLTATINDRLQDQLNKTLSDLQQSGGQLYLGVFVTNIQSGEIQEAEVYLPVLSHKYTMDLSRTRSYFLPGYPLDVVVVMRLPDGSPAAGVSVNIDVPGSSEQSLQSLTDQEGAVFHSFNIDTTAQITVQVTADGLRERKIIKRASSPSNSYLYLSFTHKVYSVNDLLAVTYNTMNGPSNGFIYYMVLSRGTIIKHGSLPFGSSVKQNLQITPDMVPSFRLIGYFYNQRGDIISDSVWVDVRDECEIKVEVERKGPFKPGRQSVLEFNLHGQRAKVALLAVDKAIYALNADNKLTGKQVFSAMQSYDLGCSYSGGGSDTTSVLRDAGLAFVSQSQSEYRRDFGCDSQSARQRRSVDLQQEMMTLKSNFTDEKLQECCGHGFSRIPMTLTCQERANRVALVQRNQDCADAFLKCCLEGERLRQKKMQEDAQKGLGRTASTADIEQFLMDSASQYIRRFFPPSFAFTEFDINNKQRYSLSLPDSITTWEIQVITLSAASGFCVVKPTEVRAFKRTFVSLRLPYSVKKYEQISISPVIYNYGHEDLKVAVHMEQTEGLCSPGSATTAAFVNITVEPESSQFVSFSAVPMVIGSIPIKIRLYDIENEMGTDAVEKTLNVWEEGLEQRVEETLLIKLDGRSTITIDGTLPDEIIPDSSSNIFISLEENGFSSQAKNLLSLEKVYQLIVLPGGCLEQTMSGLVPTASALRYLDLSEQWFNLPPGARDDALDKAERGYMRILDHKKSNGAYGTFSSVRSSNWVTAYVLKVLSWVAERQTVTFGERARTTRVVPSEQIADTVSYLVSIQKSDGSFSDPQPVLHRHVLKGKDQEAYMTAFITLSLHRSLRFLKLEARNNAEASILRSTTYLTSNVEELQHPYAVAITAYCLAVCLPEGTDLSSVWTKLQGMATEGMDGCYMWTGNSAQTQRRADAITIETTAYALLTAVALKKTEWADKAACWLVTQENYAGGFISTQDTVMALEALAEYELKRSTRPEANLLAEFTVPGRGDIVKLSLQKKEKVETDLKKFAGKNIVVQLSGKGDAKLKFAKAYHVLDPKDDCAKLSISVTVEGKVKYTAKIIETYEYYDDYDNNEDEDKETRMKRSAIEWWDAHTRSRRDLDNNPNPDGTVTYRVCVSHSLYHNLSGMAIADITLLSGFEADTEDLDRLKEIPEQYISHYEVSYGRVLLYFNELYTPEECIRFDAIQRVPIGLLQPAPAVFYDYYEPNQKCTVFYSAPQRSKLVSKLCSEDVCQCAERPCHRLKMTFKSERNRPLTQDDRVQHACFFPTVDYAYMIEVLNVSMRSNFELYKTKVIQVLRSNADMFVTENSVRVFAKRRQCKGGLDLGKQYLIMGKDGSTTDSDGAMQYLLESNTWVEKKPQHCRKSAHQAACKGFREFNKEYKLNGCKQ
ncbi:complement C4-B [Lates calcarifer]|uniref:Complement C4-B n=1 Tax=Lates calcarifer TaxID=8187 RepID=A0AAJ8DUC8_LATCA|nr:complement C4-B [Lates calcarifer]